MTYTLKDAWQLIEIAPKNGTPIIVTRFPSKTRPPRNAVAWSRGPAKSAHRWRIWGYMRHPLRYQPTHWIYMPEPCTNQA